MRGGRLHRWLFGLLAVIILAILGGRALELGPWADPKQHPRSQPPDEATARSITTSPSGSHLDPSAPETPRPHLFGAAQRWARDAGLVGDPRPSIKLSRIFSAEYCSFGVNAHCREWSERAVQCERGDAEACVRLGDLLIDEAPMQPLWGSVLLQNACELGRDEVCERGHQWNEWSTYGYDNHLTGTDEPPIGLADACTAGNLVACGLIEMRHANSGGRVDQAAAMASCRAGFRDVCSTLAYGAKKTGPLIAALEAGCDIPDARMCYQLAGYYSSDCAADGRPACPEPNLQRAQYYRKLACQLDPEMTPCSTDD